MMDIAGTMMMYVRVVIILAKLAFKNQINVLHVMGNKTEF